MSEKYVNNTDLKKPPTAGSPAVAPAAGAPLYDLIELFYFAYRDFVSDADRLLVCDERGQTIDGDQILALIAR